MNAETPDAGVRVTRQTRRHRDFVVQLEVTNPDFIRPPRESQRRWLINRALGELVWDLERLDQLADDMVPGSEGAIEGDRTQGELRDDELMEDWQVPVVDAMARVVAREGADILEIGFGRGVSASRIQEIGVASHTVVECNDDVVRRFRAWKERFPERDIRLIRGRWQDTVDQLGTYDGVFFHTYPLNADEAVEYVARSVTFAAHFFPVAAAHLRAGGRFTYLTNEIDSFSRAHQRLLFQYFRRVTLEVVGPLPIPDDSRDDVWGRSMVVVEAIR